jgi:hypothetical protein
MKTLRITFSGICTIAPGYPRLGEQQAEEVFVTMPAARRAEKAADDESIVARHYPFIYLPQANYAMEIADFERPTPRAFTVYDTTLGACDVFLIDKQRIEPDTTNQPGIRFHVTDVTPPVDRADARWLADMREIIPAAEIDAACDPRDLHLDTNRVAAVIRLRDGVITSHFPCQSAEQVIEVPGGAAIQRVFASEFVVTIQYPIGAEPVRLTLIALGDGDPHDNLLLYWGARDVLDIRMGNDTFEEIVALQKNDCTPPPDSPDVDRDFELHYAISTKLPVSERPVPHVAQLGETRHNGCLASMANLPSGG